MQRDPGDDPNPSARDVPPSRTAPHRRDRRIAALRLRRHPGSQAPMNHAFGRTAALKAVIWTTGSTYIGYILGLLINILIARRLDAADFGRYAYLVWLSGVLVLIANNGLTTTGIKFVSETLGRNAPDEAASVYGWLR